VLARLILGGVFLYTGLAKGLVPVDFLKLLREYGLVETPLLLNSMAVTLPWLEVLCGLLLLAGIAIQGTALLSLSMLLPFTAVVWQRALAIQAATGTAFCGIRFDCGCGTGEVNICRKLLENGVLVACGLFLVLVRRHRWAAWPGGTTDAKPKEIICPISDQF
jgi:hypothetical protein